LTRSFSALIVSVCRGGEVATREDRGGAAVARCRLAAAGPCFDDYDGGI